MAQNTDEIRTLILYLKLLYTACQTLDLCLVICKHLRLYLCAGHLYPHKGKDSMNHTFLLKAHVPVNCFATKPQNSLM